MRKGFMHIRLAAKRELISEDPRRTERHDMACLEDKRLDYWLDKLTDRSKTQWENPRSQSGGRP